jgi:hypothetical protein
VARFDLLPRVLLKSFAFSLVAVAPN